MKKLNPETSGLSFFYDFDEINSLINWRNISFLLFDISIKQSAVSDSKKVACKDIEWKMHANINSAIGEYQWPEEYKSPKTIVLSEI